jgi:hypothetical protein
MNEGVVGLEAGEKSSAFPVSAKQCYRCKEIKPMEEYYPHKGKADGRLGKCKPCQCRDVRMAQHRRIIRERDDGEDQPED